MNYRANNARTLVYGAPVTVDQKEFDITENNLLILFVLYYYLLISKQVRGG